MLIKTLSKNKNCVHVDQNGQELKGNQKQQLKVIQKPTSFQRTFQTKIKLLSFTVKIETISSFYSFGINTNNFQFLIRIQIHKTVTIRSLGVCTGRIRMADIFFDTK